MGRGAVGGAQLLVGEEKDEGGEGEEEKEVDGQPLEEEAEVGGSGRGGETTGAVEGAEAEDVRGRGDADLVARETGGEIDGNAVDAGSKHGAGLGNRRGGEAEAVVGGVAGDEIGVEENVGIEHDGALGVGGEGEGEREGGDVRAWGRGGAVGELSLVKFADIASASEVLICLSAALLMACRRPRKNGCSFRRSVLSRIFQSWLP